MFTLSIVLSLKYIPGLANVAITNKHDLDLIVSLLATGSNTSQVCKQLLHLGRRGHGLARDNVLGNGVERVRVEAQRLEVGKVADGWRQVGEAVAREMQLAQVGELLDAGERLEVVVLEIEALQARQMLELMRYGGELVGREVELAQLVAVLDLVRHELGREHELLEAEALLVERLQDAHRGRVGAIEQRMAHVGVARLVQHGARRLAKHLEHVAAGAPRALNVRDAEVVGERLRFGGRHHDAAAVGRHVAHLGIEAHEDDGSRGGDFTQFAYPLPHANARTRTR